MKYKDIAKEIATVHQQNTVPDDITVKELIAYGRMPHKKYFAKNSHDDEEIVKWAIETTGLESLKDKEVMSMSGGERQRIVLARALLNDFNILLLDESLSEVDIKLEREILKNIFKMYKDKIIIVVSHRMDNKDLFDKIINLKTSL